MRRLGGVSSWGPARFKSCQPYLRIYTDEDGQSGFETLEFAFAQDFAPPAQASNGPNENAAGAAVDYAWAWLPRIQALWVKSQNLLSTIPNDQRPESTLGPPTLALRDKQQREHSALAWPPSRTRNDGGPSRVQSPHVAARGSVGEVCRHDATGQKDCSWPHLRASVHELTGARNRCDPKAAKLRSIPIDRGRST
jgi:hypothetical protein